MSFWGLRKIIPAEEWSEASSAASNGDLSSGYIDLFNEMSGHFSAFREQLKSLSSSTEGEFLAIGAKLHDISRRASQIASSYSDISSEMTGEDISTAINALQRLLTEIGAYVVETGNEIEAGTSTLENISHLLEKVDEPLSGFKKVIKNLNMLGTSTKIESSRLGKDDAGFKTLAEDVSKLSEKIEQKSAIIMEHKGSLHTLITVTLSSVKRLKKEQRDHTRQIIEDLSSQLTALSDTNQVCSRAAWQISEHSRSIAESMGEIVSSLQFHDITRQQMEHVHEALDELLAKSSHDSGHLDKERFVNEYSIEIRDCCELQVRHLVNARDELSEAVESVINNLLQIAASVAEMSVKSKEMAGGANSSDDSFLDNVESCLKIVNSSLQSNTKEYHELTSIMSSVATTVGDIASFVTDIEYIGTEIELIALNSQIKAAHTGNEGMALGVLAEAIQHLSVDARQRSNAVSEILTSITTVTGQLIAHASAEESELDKEINTMLTELQGLVVTIQGMSSHLYNLLHEIDISVKTLSSDIETNILSINVHVDTNNCVNDVISGIEGLLKHLNELVPSLALVPRKTNLESHAKRYTMHSERKVHDLFTNKTENAPGGRVNRAKAQAEPSSSDLGDNVDLF